MRRLTTRIVPFLAAIAAAMAARNSTIRVVRLPMAFSGAYEVS